MIDLYNAVDRLTQLPVLSIKQPWASYVAAGTKVLELRTRRPAYRGWIWVHASKLPDSAAMTMLGLTEEDFQYGGMVGFGLLRSCVPIPNERTWTQRKNQHLSPGLFQSECIGWEFSDAICLPRIIECRGQVQLGRMNLSQTTAVRMLPSADRSLLEIILQDLWDHIGRITA